MPNFPAPERQAAFALPPAMHWTIVGADIQGFGSPERTRPHQLSARAGLYRTLAAAFASSGIPWDDCYREDRGDGVLILIPPSVPKCRLVEGLLHQIVAELAHHNLVHDHRAQIRLRLAVHAGELQHDDHGVTGTALITAFRLLEAEVLRTALRHTSAGLAVISSSWFFDEVVRHSPGAVPSWRRVRVSVKETRTTAWIWPT